MRKIGAWSVSPPQRAPNNVFALRATALRPSAHLPSVTFFASLVFLVNWVYNKMSCWFTLSWLVNCKKRASPYGPGKRRKHPPLGKKLTAERLDRFTA